jgi:diguanylate cyclase (GGDEF)-like protein
MVIDMHSGFLFMNMIASPLLPFLLVVAFWALYKGHNIAKIYLMALSIYLISMAILSQMALCSIPYSLLSSNAPIIGSFFEIILLSLLLAYRINILREEKIKTQNILLEHKADEEVRLTKMVKEKTDELSMLNKKLEIELQEKKKLEKILLHEVATDSLTGILNRRAFFNACVKEMNIAKRYKHDLSFIIIDIDYFKDINDKYGHLNGDIVLIDLVNTIKNTIRTTDIFGRIGGEEFAVLMPQTNLDNATQLAERIRSNIEKTEILFEDECVNVTVSIGLSYLQSEDSIIQNILRRADEALFKAKKNGRNQLFNSNQL